MDIKKPGLFTEILKRSSLSAPKEGQKSRDWFRQQASKIRSTPSFRTFAERGGGLRHYTGVANFGEMVMFNYDPKLKDKLPYYDTVPLIICIGIYPDGFLGINFHYLPPGLRASLLDIFYESVSRESHQRRKFNMDYRTLKAIAGNSLIAPTIHRYLYSHVHTGIIRIPPAEWDSAIFLPWARFQKSIPPSLRKTRR